MTITSVLDDLDFIKELIYELVDDKGKDQNHYEKIRDYVMRYMGPDAYAIYENVVHYEGGVYWIDDNATVKKIWKRMMHIKSN